MLSGKSSGFLCPNHKYKDIFLISSSTKSKSFVVIAFLGSVIEGLYLDTLFLTTVAIYAS